MQKALRPGDREGYKFPSSVPYNCMKPHIDRRAEITRPAHDTDMGTEKGPSGTVHRFDSLIKWPIATKAKISDEIAT